MPQMADLKKQNEVFMKKDDEMVTEAVAQENIPAALPAEADPATAALTAGRAPEPEDAGGAEEEQEDPYAGRSLPEEAEDDEPEDEWILEADMPEESAVQEKPVALPPAGEPSPEETQPLALPPAAVPAAPATASSATARQQYWRGVLTGAAETVPDAVRERAGLDDAGLTEEQRDYRLLSTINRSWAADNLGLSREQVRSGWPQLRRELAERYRVGDDEQELFTALSLEAQDAPQREQATALYEQHYRSALLGKPLELPDSAELPFARELASEAQSRGGALRRQYLPLASQVAEGLNVFASLEEDAVAAPRVFSSSPELVSSIESLAELDERSRQLVYAMAQEEFRQQHPEKHRGLFHTALRSVRRGATGMGMGVGQALAHTAVATLDSLGRALGEERGEALHEQARALDLRARITEELRQVLYEEVMPLQVSEEAGLAGQLFVDAAGATPAAAVAFCGGAGFATLSLSGMGEAVSAARSRAPEGSHWLQYLAGVVGGGIQASIYAGMSRVGGQMLSNTINRFARASGTGVGGYTLASLGVLGSLGVEEAKLLFAAKTADAVGLGAQELASRLDKTASNIDWKAYGENALDVELNLREAAMTLPFILIGSGRVALRHFRSRDAVLGDGYALQRWGIDEATCEAIMKEGDINRQGDMLRDALRGSRRWSAPGFVAEAMRALRLLNTDYYQGFKDPQVVRDFLQLPSQSSLVPRPPLEVLSPENPEHAARLLERHGSLDKVNRNRLWEATQLREEWLQKAHIVEKSPENELMLPTSERRNHYATELRQVGGIVPHYLLSGGSYAPQGEAARMAVFRDRSAELQNLSFQMLLTLYPLDALTHSTRGLNHLRQSCEATRQLMLTAVGRSILRRATGVPEEEALDELGNSISQYFSQRRYSSFPPGWMSRVSPSYTRKLDEYAQITWSQELADMPVELQDAYRVALGARACASALYELLPALPDFQTSLARGLSPLEAYVHLLSRELEVPLGELPEVKEMLQVHGRRGTDMRAFRLHNEKIFDSYSRLTGYGFESSRSDAGGRELWRVRRPDGSYTRWHRRWSDAMNDMVANASLIFQPLSCNRVEPFRVLDPNKPYDLNAVARSDSEQFTGYDNLCRVALRDTARSWLESAPYALPGFELSALRKPTYLGGSRSPLNRLLKEEEASQSVQVDSTQLSSPLRLAQARFCTYWWRQLSSGLLSAEKAGDELVKLRVISPEELERVKNIAKPRLKPRGKNVPLKNTPPPNVSGMHRALAEHLTDFSMRYFLGHLDDMPLPGSAREWFRLAPLCPLKPEEVHGKAVRLSLRDEQDRLTCAHNRMAASELREAVPAVADMRRAEREGLLMGSPLLEGLRRAIGLNQVQNLEQAWCANRSGQEAMMTCSPLFWKLMEQPVVGWQAMDAAEQGALRRGLEIICRNEPVPSAMEAEARGESPDYVLHALQNLQDVLEDYPNLHRYGLESTGDDAFVRLLQPDEPWQGEKLFSVPEEAPVPPYTAGPLKTDFQLGQKEPLPESLRMDSRVLPALELLEQLRSYPSSRPYTRREGIQWKNELYGGLWGRHPRGLERGWKSEEPLVDLIGMLYYIGRLQAELPEGGQLSPLASRLPELRNEKLDLRALRNVTLYRSEENPSVLCRLMPGESESANSIARAPYIVQSIAGAHIGNSLALRKPEDMYRSYVPLESFVPYRSRMGTEKVRRSFSRASVDYTLSGMLSEAVRTTEQENPLGGIAGLRELLMRFAEDTGFSRSLAGISPQQLSYGQIEGLRLARELLLCVCGVEPETAYRRFVSLGESISRNEDSGEALQRALNRSAENLYQEGTALFREPRERKPRKRKPQKRRSRLHTLTEAEKEALNAWLLKHKDEELDGFNSHLYSGESASGGGSYD